MPSWVGSPAALSPTRFDMKGNCNLLDQEAAAYSLGADWPAACFQKFLFKHNPAHLCTHRLLSGLNHGDE